MKQTQKVFIDHLDQMKPLRFLEFMGEVIGEKDGVLSEPKFTITEKIDGSALRIGIDDQYQIFIESATSPPTFLVGEFEARDRKKGYNGKIGQQFDYLLREIQQDANLVSLLKLHKLHGGMKIIGEVLLPSMIRSQEGNLVTFIRIPYDRTLLGDDWTFVPIKVLDGEGNRHKYEGGVINSLFNISNKQRMYVKPTAKLKRKINLCGEIADLQKFTLKHAYNLVEILSSRTKIYRDGKKWYTSEIKVHQDKMRDKILSCVESSIFGPTVEGLVIECPNGNLIKVITPEFKNTQFTP